MGLYKSVRFPQEAYFNLIDKKLEMEKRLKELTGKRTNLPLTAVLKMVSSKGVFIRDEDLINLGRRYKK